MASATKTQKQDKKAASKAGKVINAKPGQTGKSLTKAAAKKAASKKAPAKKAATKKAATKSDTPKEPGKIAQIIALHEKGHSNKEIIDMGYSKSTVSQQVAKYKQSIAK